MKTIKIFLCLISILLCHQIEGQQKFEREYRIKKDTVPQKAIDFVLSLNLKGKIKWFGEESLQGKSIEAKVKHLKKRYSIEFNTDGTLQDVEIEISQKEIPQETLRKMQQHLSSEFNSFKFVKIQKQLSGPTNSILNYMNNGQKGSVVIKYEIVLKGTLKKRKELYEFTFLKNGDFEKREKIVFKNADHLEY